MCTFKVIKDLLRSAPWLPIDALSTHLDLCRVIPLFCLLIGHTSILYDHVDIHSHSLIASACR